MIIKILLLREYNIEVIGFTIVLIGALVVAKVVLVLEYLPVPFIKGKSGWLDVLVRTTLYSTGVFIVMAIEKSIEARHEYGGVFNSFKSLLEHSDIYHLWVNIICVFGAILLFNIWTVFKKHYGKGVFPQMMMSPIPEKGKHSQ